MLRLLSNFERVKKLHFKYFLHLQSQRFITRLVTPVIKIKLNHLTQHFLIPIFSRAKDLPSITIQHQPTHSAKSHSDEPHFPEKKKEEKEFYDSWFALFLDVIFAVKPQPYILLCPSLCVCGGAFIMDSVMIYIVETFPPTCLTKWQNFPRKWSKTLRGPFAIKNEIYLNDENHGHG